MSDADPQAPWPPPAPPAAQSCPRCGASALAKPSPQRCRCGLTFELYAGPFLDTGLEADKVVSGPLDPLTGRIPMTATVIAYRGVYTVTLWRRIPWGQAVALLLLPVPFAAFLWWVALAFSSLPAAGGALLMSLPIALAFNSVFRVQAHFARVVGARETLTIRYDKPAGKRARFRKELLRRCGIEPRG